MCIILVNKGVFYYDHFIVVNKGVLLSQLPHQRTEV